MPLDGTRTLQVLRNLLSNALKVSPQGGTIELSLSTGEDSVLVTVSDQGTGIPEEELDTIFGEFVQSSKTKLKAGGTGLGLSICREIITAHGGRIWAENRPEGGAVFCCGLPLAGPIVERMPNEFRLVENAGSRPSSFRPPTERDTATF